MDDLHPSNRTLIDQMFTVLTPEQRDAAEWRIAHSGKITTQEFKVCMSGTWPSCQELNVSCLDIYWISIRSRIGCLHWPYPHPN